jgi:polysaccharide deacetylase family protein (PEP-CTERM system associated)
MKRMAGLLNAFTIDVEDYFHAAALAPVIGRDTWSSLEYRAERNTDRLLQLLAAKGVRGTFFLLGWVAERSPQLVRRIAAAGHEVASHGYSHECVYRQSVEQFRQETARSKGLLEDIVGEEVIGYRAASFSITRASLWALDVLLDFGFRYDSSIFPIRHDRYGIPGAARYPGAVTAPSGRQIVEFPMSTARWLGQPVPVSGGGYFRIFPYWLTRAGLRQINERQRQPFVFYLHPWEIDPQQPRVDAGWTARMRHYTNLDRCEARLQALLEDFSFAPIRDVLTSCQLLNVPIPKQPSQLPSLGVPGAADGLSVSASV